MRIMQADVTFEWEEGEHIPDHVSAKALEDFLNHVVRQAWSPELGEIKITLGAYGEK